jgi:1-acyl-sn-glycerol-3-phosphate acyltransferase
MMFSFLCWVMRFVTGTYLIGCFRVTGREQVPRRGPLLVCANHASTIDPPMVPAFLPRRDSWSMAKSEYFAKKNFTSWIFTKYHAFPVRRHSADRRALTRAFDELKAGHALILYPEGTRVESGGLVKAEPGAGFIAQLSGAPVLPVALIGTRECFHKGSRLPRRVPVELRFGRPFKVRKRAPDGSRIDRQEAADAIMLRIAELLPEAMRGEYADLIGLRHRLDHVYEPG